MHILTMTTNASQADGAEAMACDIIQGHELPTFRENYYLLNRPVVIKGLSLMYECELFQWSVEYFGKRMGDAVVPVMKTSTGFLSYEREFASMPFHEFVAHTFRDTDAKTLRYYYKNPTSLLPPGLDDSERIDALRSYIQKAMLRNLWISGSGLTVGLHFDPAENLNFQLRGEKKFTLYPPGIRRFYPLPMFSQTAHISGVYREGPNPDLKRFPRFDPTVAISATLTRGDVLYLPAYWWHQVESVGTENVNFNCWWFPKLKTQVKNWNQALRGHIQTGLRMLRHGNLQKTPLPKFASGS